MALDSLAFAAVIAVMSTPKDLSTANQVVPPSSGADQPPDADIAGFEASLKELEGLIDRLESGDLSLDEGLKIFERGIVLARSCQQTLTVAEQRVMTLIGDDDVARPLSVHEPASANLDGRA